jgi:hypothetical protein
MVDGGAKFYWFTHLRVRFSYRVVNDLTIL